MNSITGRFEKGHPFYGDLSKPNYFKKGHIPWNKKKPQIKFCVNCKNEYLSKSQKQKYCSRKCQLAHNTGRFKIGHSLLKGSEKGWFNQKHPAIRYWKNKKRDKKTNEKRLKKWIKSIKLTPNKQEQKIIQLIKENNFPYKFVGDGQFVIAGKIPDFVQCNGQKKIIELFGDYWHTKDEEIKRKKLFSEYGFQTLVIWEHDLKNTKEVIKMIERFEKTGDAP